MTKQEFLQKSDVNILDYYVSDSVDDKCNEGFDIFLKVGKTEEEIENELENIPAEELAKNPKISFSEYEIMLTKENLLHLLAALEYAEENGPDYLDDEVDE